MESIVESIVESSISKTIFIIGTDTDCGKTVLTAALLGAFAREGVKASGIKAVQTGCQVNKFGALVAPDLEIYTQVSKSLVKCYFKFRNLCSPHLAAKLEEESIDYKKLVELIKNDSFEGVKVIEGAGGLFVPLDGEKTFQDIIKDLNARVILVVSNKLGAINHALLTIEALKSNRADLAGFVLTPNLDSSTQSWLDKEIQKDNRETIERLGGTPCLAELPFEKDLEKSAGDAAFGLAWDRLASILQLALPQILGSCKVPVQNLEKV